jgi:hypothetical protein
VVLLVSPAHSVRVVVKNDAHGAAAPAAGERCFVRQLAVVLRLSCLLCTGAWSLMLAITMQHDTERLKLAVGASDVAASNRCWSATSGCKMS